VWGVVFGGGGWQLTVRGGRTRRSGARGVFESVNKRLEWAVHGVSAAMGVEQGGAAVRGQSWKDRRGAPAWGGTRGGNGQAGWWLEEAALGGPGCGGRHWHSARRKQRWGVSGRLRLKRGSLSVGRSPYSCTRRWPRAAELVGGKWGGR
jgi:hypothetical protein